MAPTKRAVVYILDASPSMNASFPISSKLSSSTIGGTTEEDKATTRWASAKKALIRMIGSLMLQKKDNECSVMILKTRGTRHHLTVDPSSSAANDDDADDNDDDAIMHIKQEEDDLVVPYCHITEITPGIVKPTCHLLKQIEQGDFDGDSFYNNNNNNNNSTMETASAKIDDKDNDSKYRYDSQQEADFLLPSPQEGDNSNENAGAGGGDIAHGIILAMDALYKKTKRFKFDRSIVLISDAVHQGMVDFQQLLFAIDILRDDLQCPIYVMGMDFNPSSSAATSSSSLSCSSKFAPAVVVPDPASSSSSSSRMLPCNNTAGNKIHQALYKGPQEWQSFLHLVLDKTGGQINVVHDEKSLQTLADTNFAGPSCQVKEASGFKCDFRLAPGVSLPVKTFVLCSQTGCKDPGIKRNKAFMMTSSRNRSESQSQQMSQSQQQYSQSQFSQSQQVPRLNSLGQRMLVDVEIVTKYVDLDENPDALMDVFQTAKAIRYSKHCPTDKLIPVDQLQKNFLKVAGTKDGRTIEVLGYMPRCNVPMTLVMGPPVLLAGGNTSQKATAMITALARALFRLDLVAIVMYTKSKNGKPLLGGLFPKDDEIMQSKNKQDSRATMHLLFSELPFAQDVARVQSEWQEQASEVQDEQTQQQKVEDNKAAAACDNLIDALMLPDDGDEDKGGMNNNHPVSISNPMAQSWKQTILQRVLDREAPIVDARCGTIQAKDDPDDNMDVDTTDEKKENDAPLLVDDPMATPPDLLKQAESSLRAFYEAFPIKSVPATADAGKKKAAS